MLKFAKYLLWILVLLAIGLGLDQMLTRVPLTAPGLVQTQRFYIDFRQRLGHLFFAGSAPEVPATIEGLIDRSTPEPAPGANPSGSRYLYVDGDGVLQFADSLQQVPVRYRDSAQPLVD